MNSQLPEDRMNVAEIICSSRIYGPGKRFVVWVQGCDLKCPGCWNQGMWAFEEKKLYTPEELAALVNKESDIEGVTILGGEPLYQSKAILSFAKLIKDTGHSLMLYTGFEMDEIKDDHSKALIACSDIVVFGRYLEELRSISLKWRGSSNQKICFNTPIYENLIDLVNERVNETEIHVDEAGCITVVGYPDDHFFEVVVDETGD